MDYVLVDTEARKKHLASLYEEIQWPFIRTPKWVFQPFPSWLFTKSLETNIGPWYNSEPGTFHSIDALKRWAEANKHLAGPARADLCSYRRYYLDTLNDPFVMDDPRCALITEQAYAYFKLSYQEKVGK